jgi:hypothetical protein
MKVEVIYKTNNSLFKQLFPFGYVTDLNVILNKKEYILKNVYTVIDKETNKFKKIVEEQVIPKGNYGGYKVKGNNHKMYSDKSIINMIGYIPLKKLFKEII